MHTFSLSCNKSSQGNPPPAKEKLQSTYIREPARSCSDHFVKTYDCNQLASKQAMTFPLRQFNETAVIPSPFSGDHSASCSFHCVRNGIEDEANRHLQTRPCPYVQMGNGPSAKRSRSDETADISSKLEQVTYDLLLRELRIQLMPKLETIAKAAANSICASLEYQRWELKNGFRTSERTSGDIVRTLEDALYPGEQPDKSKTSFQPFFNGHDQERTKAFENLNRSLEHNHVESNQLQEGSFYGVTSPGINKSGSFHENHRAASRQRICTNPSSAAGTKPLDLSISATASCSQPVRPVATRFFQGQISYSDSGIAYLSQPASSVSASSPALPAHPLQPKPATSSQIHVVGNNPSDRSMSQFFGSAYKELNANGRLNARSKTVDELRSIAGTPQFPRSEVYGPVSPESAFRRSAEETRKPNGLLTLQCRPARAEDPDRCRGFAERADDLKMDQESDCFYNSQTDGLTPQHLKKAKLMFFFTRYPSASKLKACFSDVKLTRATTSQLIKWFSNFREFYYIQMEKFARQGLTDGITEPEQLHVSRDSELFRALNQHFNKSNDFKHIPRGFDLAILRSLREFFVALRDGKNNDSSWKKSIYKEICKLDQDIPQRFQTPDVLEHLDKIIVE